MFEYRYGDDGKVQGFYLKANPRIAANRASGYWQIKVLNTAPYGYDCIIGDSMSKARAQKKMLAVYNGLYVE